MSEGKEGKSTPALMQVNNSQKASSKDQSGASASDLTASKTQKEVSEINRLKNENRELLKKVDQLESKIANSGINPSELEQRVSMLDSELKNIIRESSDMALMLSNLYKQRKKPSTNEEYEYVSGIYNKKIKDISKDYAKIKALLMQSDETIERLKNELNEVKIKSNESNLQVQEKAKEEKKALEDKLKTLGEEFNNKFKQEEDKLNKKTQDLLEKTQEVLTLTGKVERITEENKKLSEKKQFLEKQNEELLGDVKDLKAYVKEIEVKSVPEKKEAVDILNNSEEYQEMNKLIASLMKERREPANQREIDTVLKGYREQIKFLKMERPEENEVDIKAELEKAIKEKDTINKTLESDILKLRNDIEDYKKGIADLLQKLKEEQDKRELDRKTEMSALELEEELNSIGDVLTTFIKERKQPMHSDEANAMMAHYKKEIAELKRVKRDSALEEECVRLKKQINDLEEARDKAGNYTEEINVLKDIVSTLKEELKEKTSLLEKLSTNEATQSSEGMNKDYEEMNNLLASFIKERRLPISNEETTRLINRYKEEIRELKKSGGDSEQFKKMEKLLEEKDIELDKLKSITSEHESNITRLKTQLTELNFKMKDMEKQAVKQGGSIEGDNDLREEYEEMSLFIASLIRERKRPFTDDETQTLIEGLKKEIYTLKEMMKKPQEDIELKRCKLRIEELEANLKKESDRPSEAETIQIDKSQSDVVITLKREVTELKTKLASANNKLILYGDEIIK